MDPLFLIVAAGLAAVVVIFAFRKKKPAEDQISVVQPPKKPTKKPNPFDVVKKTARKTVTTRRGRSYSYAETRNGRDYYRDDRGGDLVDFLILWWILDELSQDAYMADYPDYTPDVSYQDEAEMYDGPAAPAEEAAGDAPVSESAPEPLEEEVAAPELAPAPVQEETPRTPAPAPSYEPPADTGGGYDGGGSGDSGGSYD